ncbi:MAG TPA: PsbP-related protein [Methanobacteriaceae archaeon]|nr:PsbP-related protein [Methanobacteriaceae archaeon]
MKKIIFIGTMAVLLVLFVSGCTDNTKNQTYSGNGISFQFPTNWEQLPPENISASTLGSAEIIAAVVDPNSIQNNSYQTLVFVQRAPTSVTMVEAMAANRASIESAGGQVISQNDLTVNGIAATELIYIVSTPSGVTKKERMVVLDKNNTRFYIICSTPADGFDSQQSNFNQIIQSFQIQ